MFQVGLRLLLLATSAYLAYRANAIWNVQRNETPHTVPRDCKKCIICNGLVEPWHSKYKNNHCNCLAHKGCMELLINEGQDVCPWCRKPLSNRRSYNTEW